MLVRGEEVTLDDLARWKQVAESLRTAEFMTGYVIDCISGADANTPDHVMEEIANDAAIVFDRIRAVVAILDEIRPGVASLVKQAALEAEQRAKAMRPHLVN